MSLIKDLHKELNNLGVFEESIYESKEDGYTMVVFNEIDEGTRYNIMFAVMSDNNRVEVYVRKRIKVESDTLEKVNDLNANYSGITFFVDRPDILSVKTLCFTDGDIKVAMVNMLSCLNTATEEFIRF